MNKSHIPKPQQAIKPTFPTGKISFLGGDNLVKSDFPVEGMTCSNCSFHVEKAIKGLKGITEVKVDLKTAKAHIEYLSDIVSPQEIKNAVSDAGYNLILDKKEEKTEISTAESTKTSDSEEVSTLEKLSDTPTVNVQYPVLGMTCASCVAHVQKAISMQNGVKKASVNLANNTAYIEYTPEIINPDTIKKVVQENGYDLIINSKNESEVKDIRVKEYSKLKRNCFSALAFAIPLSVIAMFFHDIPYANYIMWALATPIVFIFGAPFFSNAWKQLKHRTSNMDTLVALSTGIAYIFSVFNTLFPSVWTDRGLEPHIYFEVSGIVIAFVLLGRFLESRAKQSTSNAIEKLIGIQPKTATIIREGKTIDISIEDITVGDIVIVKSGEAVAVDGIVTHGYSFVDESMINGEPMPVEKTIGCKVFSGTISQSGNLTYRAEKVGKDTLLAQIIKTVQEAQGSRAPIQNLVDRIASIFVPIIILLAIATFIIWLIFGNENHVSQGLLSAVTVLIIACPCALGLATPTAIMVGIGKGATMGILIKDAEALEIGKKVTSVVLDKTGTITEGKPIVNKIEWFNNICPNSKNILYSIEKYSDHPLANSITEYLNNDSHLIANISITNIPGQGLRAEYNSDTYYVGSIKLLRNNNIFISNSILSIYEDWTESGYTTVFFSNEKQPIALLAITDKIKSTSKDAISKLKAMKLKVHMLTGDNEKSARLIAQEVAIDIVKANVLPTEKAEYIKSLNRNGETTAMIGDGINDSAALACADLSIAMGKGSDIAINVAQLTIMSSNLEYIPRAIKLSKATVQTIHQNLFWAFIYNIIGVPLAAGILYPINGFLLNPMIAGAAMALSSICVVTNSLLLKFRKI